MEILETLGNKNKPKTSLQYLCKICDYCTSKKSNYDSHVLTVKHKKWHLETNGNKNKPKTSSPVLTCEKCCKEFKNRSGLWKH